MDQSNPDKKPLPIIPEPPSEPQSTAAELQALQEQLAAERSQWKQEREALNRRIEQLQKSESRFQMIVEHIPDTVALYDSQLSILYVSPSIGSLQRLPSEALEGKQLEDIWPEFVAKQILPFLREALEIGSGPNTEIILRSPDHPVQVRLATAVRIAGIEPTLLVISHDITAEQHLLTELRENDRRKSEFIAVLSHELRNPLGVIRNNLSILERSEPKSEAAMDARAVLLRQSNQLSRLVDDLMDLSRIEQNKVQLRRERLDLRALAQSVLEDCHLLFEQCGITMESHLGDKAVLVNGDRARLIQVIGNLLYNASKFTPRGGQVKLSLQADKALGQARIIVEDNGAGIEPAMLETIFQPFVQADRTLDRSQGGLGLGLSLVKGLVELHGGKVEAHSEGLGRGTTFTLSFPMEDGALPEPLSRPDIKTPIQKRILIIEDNVDAAKAMKMLLRMDGHEVEMAHDGPSGIAKGLAFKPDILFCDIGLPGMNGYDVARAFRADPELQGVFLVALTGYTQPEDLDKAREAGFVRHVRKPAEFEHIEAILAELCTPIASPTS